MCLSPTHIVWTLLMRYRVRGTMPRKVVKTDNWHFLDTDHPNTYEYDGDYDYEETVDDPHPGFYKRIRAGELILSPYSHIRSVRSCPDGHTVSHPNPPPGGWSRTGSANWTAALGGEGVQVTLSGDEAPSDATLFREAVSRADPSDANMMEDLLELRKTFDSLRSPLKGLKKIAGKIRRTRGQSTGVADAWLEYRMQWMPLYHSLNDALRVLGSQLKRYESGIRLRASSTGHGFKSFSGQVWSSGDAGNLYAIHEAETIRKRAIVYYRLRVSTGGLAQSLGLRIKDIPTGLWNTVRLSFMVDRMFDLSTYFSAMSNILDVNIIWEGGCCVSRSTHRRLTQLVSQKYDYTYSVSTPPVITSVAKTVRTVGIPWEDVKNPLAIEFKPQGLFSTAERAADFLALAYKLKG